MANYYWCLTHGQVEEGTLCPAVDRLGPYDSPEAAKNWNERVEQRQEAWEAEDERWHGTDDDEDEDGS